MILGSLVWLLVPGLVLASQEPKEDAVKESLGQPSHLHGKGMETEPKVVLNHDEKPQEDTKQAEQVHQSQPHPVLPAAADTNPGSPREYRKGEGSDKDEARPNFGAESGGPQETSPFRPTSITSTSSRPSKPTSTNRGNRRNNRSHDESNDDRDGGQATIVESRIRTVFPTILRPNMQGVGGSRSGPVVTFAIGLVLTAIVVAFL